MTLLSTRASEAGSEEDSPPTRVQTRRARTPRKHGTARPYLLLVPAFALISLVLLYPLVFNLGASFFNWRFTNIGRAEFVGVDNYIYMFTQSPDFWPALRFTVLFTVTTIALELVIGIAIAMLLNTVRRRRGLLMSLILLPFVVAPLATGLIWRMLLLPGISPVNWLLDAIGVGAVEWMSDPTAAFWGVVIAEVWHSTPFVVLMVLAAVSTMPDDIFHAAGLDGAGPWRRFWSITLPLLRPALTIVLVFETVLKLRLYDLVYIMTNGGPANATVPLGILLQREYFLNQQAGGAAAIGTVLFLLGALVSLVLVRAIYRKVEY